MSTRRQQVEAAKRRELHPDEPWLWNAQWARGRIESSDRSSLGGAWALTIFWNAVSSVVFLFVPEEVHKGNTAALFALLFPLAGLGMLLWALRATIRWRKFGTSTLELASTPVPIGGELRARLVTRLDPPPDTMRLVLTCVRRDHRGDSTSDEIVWLEERVVEAHEIRREVEGSVVPVAFAIPADAPETAPETRGESVHWKLHATAPVAGVDYATRFELPVFRTRDIVPQPQLATSHSATRAVPRPVAHQSTPVTSHTVSRGGPAAGVRPAFDPAKATVSARRTAHGHEFYFGPGRNTGAAASFAVMFGIFAAAAYGIARADIPVIFAAVCGFLAVLLLLAVLQIWLGTSRVTITNDHVIVRKSLLGITRTRRIPLGDVADITLQIGMSQAETALQSPRAWYDIRLQRKSGRRLTLGANVADRHEAEWLVAEIKRVMRL